MKERGDIAVTYSFDEMPDRKYEHARKWDLGLIRQHYQVPEDFIPMWIADMDFNIAPEIALDLEELIHKGALGYIYTYQDFYDAVIQWHHKRRGVELKQEWISLTYGTVSTLHNVVQCFCEPGDKVMMHAPIYEPFLSSAKKQGVESIVLALKVENQKYTIDFDEMALKMALEKPKIYFLCSPHNPSGKIWSKTEIDKILAICQKYQVLLVVDEVHSEMIIQGKFHSIGEWLDESKDVIWLTSPNKAFNLGGLKTSYSIIANPQRRKCFLEQLGKNSITSPNPFGIKALISAYNKGEAWLEEATQYIRENYKVLKENFKGSPLRWMPMEASYLLWVNIESLGEDTDEFVKTLAQDYGLIVESGNHFVAKGEGWIRMNLGMPRPYIEEACKRILEKISEKEV